MVAGMADPRTAIAYCGWQNVGVAQGKPFVPPDYETGDKMHHLLRFASLWPIHAILIRRSAMPPGVPFNPAYPACEDYDLWLRIASFHRIQLVPRVLAFYRKHAEVHATSDQARVARYNLLVKQRFLGGVPGAAAEHFAGAASRVLRRRGRGPGLSLPVEGRPGGRARDLPSRVVEGGDGYKDLKYAIPSLLPYGLYAWLVHSRLDSTSH